MSESALQLPSGSGARQSNLALALWCLPPDRRADALVFYDFCRAVDDIADDPAVSIAEKERQLGRWENALRGAESLPGPLADIVARHHLDTHLLLEIVAGMKMDIEPERFETYEALRRYCWRVACAVGLVSARLFGCQEPDSVDYAEHLGYALQLTNILRDVAEDASFGRVYLPAEDLARFGVTEAALLRGKPDGDFPGLMRFEAERARGLFQQARQTLPVADKTKLLSAEIMRTVYEKILQRMERDGFRVFQKRYRLGKIEKLWIFFSRSLLKWT